MLFQIEKNSIFIDSEKFKQLEEIVLDGKNRHDFARELYGSNILWIDVWQDVMNKIYNKIEQLLMKEYQEDRKSFFERYLKFQYFSLEAKKNVFDILYAYSLQTKNATITPLAISVSDHLYIHEGYGQKFLSILSDKVKFGFNTKTKSIIQKLVDKRWDIIIELPNSSVNEVSGNLGNFTIKFDGFQLQCGKQVSILLEN